MTKLNLVLNTLKSMGYKAKLKGEVVTIRGYRFTVKGETIFTHNHKSELVSYGYSLMTALSGIVKEEQLS